jgi:hypothetical protein
MAQRTVTRLLLGGLLLASVPGLAWAQQEVGPKDLTRDTADPVDRLVGLWHVDKIEGAAPSGVVSGGVLRIDRQTVATLTLGTCSNPSFDEALGAITVTCLGQKLASAEWNPERPGSLRWSEGDLHAQLSRISGTEAIDSPPPAADSVPADAAPAEDDQGSGDAE